ncbi:hypothetical protein BDV93DRAFT_503964 [Ceratobasidium sp. AG-I]|nr:hypothetical protein BDV93DRAFT_503964 [Ceratobasidium sp. AG-I]
MATSSNGWTTKTLVDRHTETVYQARSNTIGLVVGPQQRPASAESEFKELARQTRMSAPGIPRSSMSLLDCPGPPPSFPPPLPPTSYPRSAIRRVVSESRPSQRHHPIRAPALPRLLTSAWANENEESIVPCRKPKYGLPPNPREPPSPGPKLAPVRTLRPTPDSRRLNTKDFDPSTIKKMQAHLGDLGDIHAHALALSGRYGGMDAHYAALDARHAEMNEEDRVAWELMMQMQRASALDLAVPRKASAGSTLLLPDFTLLHGAVPLSPGQGVPSSPVYSVGNSPERSPHPPFEWDNPNPFGVPMSAPMFGQSRPVSVEERHSTARKASQPELDIELARKPRPATLQAHGADAESVNAVRTGGKKRLGVILDRPVVLDEMEKRYGGRRL